MYEDATRQQLVGDYYDADRAEACRPRAWSDGARYCTPAADQAMFLDAGCTTAVARVPAGTAPARYAIATYMLRGVAHASRMAELAAPTTPPEQRWELHDGLCLGPYTLDGGFDYYELGAAIDRSALVRVKRALPIGAGQLARLDDTSDDGLRVAVGIFDHDAGEECAAVERANADRIECVPITAALASYFHDAACTQPELSTASGSPTLARRYTLATSCWSYYAVGAEVSAPPLYELVGGACIAVAAPGGEHLFLTGEPREVPLLAREREVSERRLQQITRLHGELRITDPLLYDSELATDCVHAADRCVPATNTRVQPFFADDMCSQPIDLALAPAGTCDPPSAFARDGDAFRPLLARHAAPIYELSTGDRCGLYVPPVPLAAYAVGAAVPVERFLAAELTNDP